MRIFFSHFAIFQYFTKHEMHNKCLVLYSSIHNFRETKNIYLMKKTFILSCLIAYLFCPVFAGEKDIYLSPKTGSKDRIEMPIPPEATYDGDASTINVVVKDGENYAVSVENEEGDKENVRHILSVGSKTTVTLPLLPSGRYILVVENEKVAFEGDFEIE